MSGAHGKLIAELFVSGRVCLQRQAGPYFELCGPELGSEARSQTT